MGTRAVFEHYRNDTSAMARTQIEAAGFRIDAEWAVSPSTSNQWVLFASK